MNLNRSNHDAQAPAILDTLERIRGVLNFGLEEYLSLLRMSNREYHQMLKERTVPSRSAIENLADQLDLSPESILDGKIDYVALSAHFAGNPTFLPEKYRLAALSKRRTSAHLMNGVEERYGWRERQRILRKFQVNDSIFSNLDAPINIQFIIDVCNEIRHLDSRRNVLFEMGMKSVYGNFHSKLGDLYRRLKGPREIYEMTFPYFAKLYYDTNTYYRLIELSDSHCVVEVTPNPEISEAFKSKEVGSLGTCEQKRGAFACLPIYQGLPPAQVSEATCMHRGDSCCLFYVDFSLAHLVSLHRRLHRNVFPLTKA